MRTTYFLLTILLMACKKDKYENVTPESPLTLLTQKEWILTGAGFDDNKNGILDEVENTIQDCQKDNSFIFYPDGKGTSLDNASLCGGTAVSNFTWKLLNNDSELEIEFERIIIRKLTENEMVLNPVLPSLTVNFILTYRH